MLRKISFKILTLKQFLMPNNKIVVIWNAISEKRRQEIFVGKKWMGKD
jgi:hypothetical protein